MGLIPPQVDKFCFFFLLNLGVSGFEYRYIEISDCVVSKQDIDISPKYCQLLMLCVVESIFFFALTSKYRQTHSNLFQPRQYLQHSKFASLLLWRGGDLHINRMQSAHGVMSRLVPRSVVYPTVTQSIAFGRKIPPTVIKWPSNIVIEKRNLGPTPEPYTQNECNRGWVNHQQPVSKLLAN